MYKFEFGARIEADPDGGFLVTFPDVPSAITAGETETDARASASEALGLALRGVLQMGEPLPLPEATGKGLTPIAVAPETAMKLAVVEAFRESLLSKSEFARRLGKDEAVVRRILDPDHGTRPDLLASALTILGKQILIEVRDAA